MDYYKVVDGEIVNIGDWMSDMGLLGEEEGGNYDY